MLDFLIRFNFFLEGESIDLNNFDLIIAEPSFPDPPINKTFLFILNQTPNINNCFIFFYF